MSMKIKPYITAKQNDVIKITLYPVDSRNGYDGWGDSQSYELDVHDFMVSTVLLAADLTVVGASATAAAAVSTPARRK